VHIKKYPCTEKKCAERVAFGTKRDLERHRKTHNKGAARQNVHTVKEKLAGLKTYQDILQLFMEINSSPLLHALEGGAESRNRDGETSLCLADRGANVNSRDEKSGQTPLFRALKNRHRSVTALLLEKGADLILPIHLRQTSLEWAFKHRDETSVRLLLDHGAGPKLSPLRLATQHQWESVILSLSLKREVDALPTCGDPVVLQTRVGENAFAFEKDLARQPVRSPVVPVPEE